MINAFKIVIILFCLQLTACYPPSPFADCYNAPYNKNEQKIIDSLNKLNIYGNTCYLARIHLTNILNNEICEVSEPIYTLTYSIIDSNLFQNTDSLNILSKNLIQNLYLNVMDDTLKAIVDRVEVTISCLYNHKINDYCTYIKKKDLASYNGVGYVYLMGNIIKFEVSKNEKLKLYHDECFY
jgi:hypothetical protein